MSSILHGGRLAATRKDVVNFISSVEEDKRIAQATVLVNEAHVIALAKAKAISLGDARRLIAILREIEKYVPFRRGVEDVHVLIEEHVTKRAGRNVGGQLHLGKSRNDQVATAIRMALRHDMLEISNLLILLERELLQLARKHVRSLFPGYTHLQPAQPITFAHYLLAIGDSLLRDNQRVVEVYKRINTSPMGAAALAGTSVNLDRAFVARLLGFEGIIENTLDAVGSRDFVLEALSVCAITALDISRMVQDIIFYSSADVGLIDIPDEFASTSSIMPQKKNPDPLEIVRARCAHVVGNFSSAGMTMHALPSGYNLDFQEITPLLWQSVDTLKSCLRILSQLIPEFKLKKSIADRRDLQFTAATEVANALVKAGKLPFRSAHHAVGEAVTLALEQGKTLRELTPEDWKHVLGTTPNKKTLASITEMLNLSKHVQTYRTRGSPNPKQVEQMIKLRERRMQVLIRQNADIEARVRSSMLKLHGASRNI
jgi:argininosuccinate lyase